MSNTLPIALTRLLEYVSTINSVCTFFQLNSNVKRLELQENRLGGIGGMYVSSYLRANVFITYLVSIAFIIIITRVNFTCAHNAKMSMWYALQLLQIFPSETFHFHLGPSNMSKSGIRIPVRGPIVL